MGKAVIQAGAVIGLGGFGMSGVKSDVASERFGVEALLESASLTAPHVGSYGSDYESNYGQPDCSGRRSRLDLPLRHSWIVMP